MDEYKIIASSYFVQLFGKEWILQNASDLSSSMQDFGNYVEVAFHQNSYLPTEKEIIENDGKNVEYIGCIVYRIDKKTKDCILVQNTIVE